MLDSKNTIWLGSFFTLLFITFCVSKHLDDLNPHITNVQKKHDSFKMDDKNSLKELAFDTDKNDTPKFVNEIKIEEVSKVPQIEENKTIQKQPIEDNTTIQKQPIENNISKEILHIEKIQIVNAAHIKSPTPSAEKNTTVSIKANTKHILKESAKDKKVSKKKKKKVIHTYKTIDKAILSKDDIFDILDHKENNDLNRIAFRYNIYKHTYIILKSKDKKLSKKVQDILVQKNVERSQIKIKTDPKEDLVLILLKERN